MRMKAIKMAAALGCVLVATSVSQAALTAYESFTYANGTNIEGQTGGTGFGNAWNGTSATSPAVAQVQTAAALSFSTLQTSGLGLQLTYNPTGTSQVSKTFRNLSTNQTGVTYFSFLMNGTNLDADDTGKITLYNSNAPAAGTNEGLSVGKLGSGTTIGIIAFNNATNTGVGTSTVQASGATHLVVVKYDGTALTANLYIDPTPGAAEPAPIATVTGVAAAYQGIRLENFSANNGGSGNVKIDELRFGTTFADVVPVPEPGSLGLLALGGLALLRRRRA